MKRRLLYSVLMSSVLHLGGLAFTYFCLEPTTWLGFYILFPPSFVFMIVVSYFWVLSDVCGEKENEA